MKVAIVQRVLPHYRIAFFSELAKSLSSSGIELTVYYGQERPGTVPKTVQVEAPWAHFVANSYWTFGAREVVWQKVPRLMGHFDLVIIEQALRFPLNFLLQLGRLFSRTGVAFWGHGRNFQARNQNSLAESMKRRLTCAVDWWFAYTARTAEAVITAGFPSDRVTVVNNTIDSNEFRAALSGVDNAAINGLKTSLQVAGANVGLFCGGMYPEKRLDFLIAAIERIRRRVPDFECVFIGDGPDCTIVREAAARFPWVRYVGAIYGAERAQYFLISKMLLMPGLVGLAIVDSFIAEVPIATTDISIHSPEIEYLDSDKNGLICPDDPEKYAENVAEYLLDESLLLRLKQGCRESAAELTIESMVERFENGIKACMFRHRLTVPR